MLLEVRAPFAIITFNTPEKKNAMDTTLYKKLSSLLQQVDKIDAVKITVLTGKGDFFSAGADVKAAREAFPGEEARARSAPLSQRLSRRSSGSRRGTWTWDEVWPRHCSIQASHTHSRSFLCVPAFYKHSKILVAGLNGPAIGLSAGSTLFFLHSRSSNCLLTFVTAALLGVGPRFHVDFIYAVENAYFLTPFSAIGLVCEGGASLTLPRRMGIAKANEALIMGKKLSATELHQCGFINGVFPKSSDDEFRKALLAHLEQQFDGLDLEAIFAGAERFATGKPQAQFAKLASKQMRHKL
ncbi:SPOSA6832_01195, partial [Sporobolomyces salmonicolor]